MISLRNLGSVLLLLTCSTPLVAAVPALSISVPTTIPTSLPKPCPKEFALYLGPGNDARNRTWYFRGFLDDGQATRLSALPEYASTYTIVNNQLVYAANKTIKANTDVDPGVTFITMVSDGMRATRPGGENKRPFFAFVDPLTCELTLKYSNKKVYQRYGFYLHLTPPQETYTGQIQWFNKPVAVTPPPRDDSAVSTASTPKNNIAVDKPDWFYYLEDQVGNYIGPKI